MNSMMLEGWGRWVWQNSWQAAILAGLVFLAQRIFRARLTPAWRYNLWLLVVARLALPVWPASPWSLFNLAPAPRSIPMAVPITTLPARDSAPRAAAEIARRPTVIPPPAVERTGMPTAGHERVAPSARRSFVPHWGSVARWFWLGVVALFGARLAWDYLRLGFRLKQGRVIRDSAVLAVWAEAEAILETRRRLELVEAGCIQSPALFGLLRVRLLLPGGLTERFSASELRHVFLHELAHLKRGDMVLNWLMTVLQVIHWFNPVVWLALRQMRADRELACDALVLSYCREGERKTYGQTIIKLLESSLGPAPLPGLVGILERKNHMEGRIRMIARFKKTNRWPVLATVLLLGLGLLTLTNAKAKPEKGTATNAPGATAQATNKEPTNLLIETTNGLKFCKYKTFSGASDVITWERWSEDLVYLSPNLKFLIWNARVIPLDGSLPFNLVEMPKAGRGIWSPDGCKVAFYGSATNATLKTNAIWLIDVDPQTSRPKGPPRKLLEGNYDTLGPVQWLPDSETFHFTRRDKEHDDEPWTLSIKDGKMTKRRSFAMELVSPDGRYVTCANPDTSKFGGHNELWIKHTADGTVNLISRSAVAEFWSKDSHWLLYIGDGAEGGGRYLFRVADGRKVKLTIPSEVGILVGRLPAKSQLFFYRSSYEEKTGIKILSVADGSARELEHSYVHAYGGGGGARIWTPDSQHIIRKVDRHVLGRFSLAGSEPVLFKAQGLVAGEIVSQTVSPHCRYLLLGVKRDEKHVDYWTAPFSWRDMRPTGPAKLILQELLSGIDEVVWAPDETRLAFMREGDIWVLGINGGEAKRLTATPQWEGDPLQWSPDGTQIAFVTWERNPYNLNPNDPKPRLTNNVVQVISPGGGPVKTVSSFASAEWLTTTWAPDSRSLTINRCDYDIWSVPVAGGAAKRLVVKSKNDWTYCLSWCAFRSIRTPIPIQFGQSSEVFGQLSA